MATPTPRYPAYKNGWYAGWNPQGVYTPLGVAIMQIAFTAADETKDIIWPFPTAPAIDVYVDNTVTGKPEKNFTATIADTSFPGTTKYTFYNAGASGYIIAFGARSSSSLLSA